MKQTQSGKDYEKLLKSKLKKRCRGLKSVLGVEKMVVLPVIWVGNWGYKSRR